MGLTWGVSGRCVLQVFTGSVAAYRAVDVARGLRRLGARVVPAATRSALNFLTRGLLEWATGEPLYTLWGSTLRDHISVASECDLLLVDPATLDSMARVAGMHGDNEVSLLAQVFLGEGKPVLMVPAMHGEMWGRAAERLVDELVEQGVYVLEPLLEEGRAKHPPVDEVVYWVDAVAARGRDYAGLRVLVTAGPTREWIDDVRFISNPSSGAMGYAVAGEALDRGGDVVVVHGPTCLEPPRRARRIPVETAEEMLAAAEREAKLHMPHIVFHVAAPVDYRPVERFEGKIRSDAPSLELRLVQNPKVSLAVRSAAPNAIHVGFTASPALEPEGLVEEAKAKLEKHGFDVVVANAARRAFASPTNEVVVVTRDGLVEYIPEAPKRLVARRLLDIALSLHRARHRGGE